MMIIWGSIVLFLVEGSLAYFLETEFTTQHRLVSCTIYLADCYILALGLWHWAMKLKDRG